VKRKILFEASGASGRFCLVGDRLQFLALPLLRFPLQPFLAHPIGRLFDDASKSRMAQWAKKGSAMNRINGAVTITRTGILIAVSAGCERRI
jgi:hypothetical protein